ncbi:CaiB/BaiF CoA transferase family protein [Mycetohabitans sp. B46]|uniref:CaiB/BaiF CoA transferase family protein n=1 Tax=Mycetohabitans sp. B46 TaxID=2772536 RepID=UPI00307E3921
MTSITGERDVLPGGGPQKVGVAFADLMTGMYAAVAILAALSHRQRSGEGQYIDMALLDVQVATMANMNLNYLVSGKTPKRQGNAHANIASYQVFAAKDGQMVLGIDNGGQLRKFCEVAHCASWATDPRFATNAARVTHHDTLIPLIQQVLNKRTIKQWIGPLSRAGVPCGPINHQVVHRGMRADLAHPLAGTVPTVANLIKMSGSPIHYHGAPPTLSQRNKSVLSSVCGLDQEEIARLRNARVI